MESILNLSKDIGVQRACATMGVPKSTFYERRLPDEKRLRERTYARMMSYAEMLAARRALKEEVLKLLNSPRFVDMAPPVVYSTLLDEGVYLASVRQMYRFLEEAGQLIERRDTTRRKDYPMPQLLATRPNEVWSWDISKLLTFSKLVYFYLYVIEDIFSRRVVGWLIADRECSFLAAELIRQAYEQHGCVPGQLTLHADNGPSMIAEPVSQTLLKLGVARSHNRPHVSNDNPFSESLFKTAKYHPSFPGRFEVMIEAQGWGKEFFPWYNTEHKHSGIAYMTPNDVHFGRHQAIWEARAQVLAAAFAENPRRFRNKMPTPERVPLWVGINLPKDTDVTLPREMAVLS